MPITRLQANGSTFENVTNGTHAMVSNVTAGSLLVVSSARWRSSDSTGHVAGDLTKSAGTATIGTPVVEGQGSAGASQRSALFSVLVTGSGSLTLQVAYPGTGCYGSIFVGEFSGSWDSSRTEATNQGFGNSTAIDSGNATSAGAAVFVGSMSNTDSGTPTVTPDAAFEQIGEDENGSVRIVHSAIDRIVTTGTTDSASWTTTGAMDYTAVVAVFKEAAGGGGSTTLWAQSLL